MKFEEHEQIGMELRELRRKVGDLYVRLRLSYAHDLPARVLRVDEALDKLRFAARRQLLTEHEERSEEELDRVYRAEETGEDG